MRSEVDIVIFLTGVGTRALVRVIEGTYPGDTVIAALARTKVVARGPKPLAVLRELAVPVWIAVPEPNPGASCWARSTPRRRIDRSAAHGLLYRNTASPTPSCWRHFARVAPM